MFIVKPLAQQISLTTANTVSNATCVYISTTATTLVTTSNTGGTIGSFVVPANAFLCVQKNPTDSIAANVAVAATPIAFRN